MKATSFEFRFRTAIGAAIYVVGFWAPWLKFLQDSAISSMRLWSWLAIELGRSGMLSVESSYPAVTTLAVIFGVLGAALRLWGTAYLGRGVVFDPTMQAGEVVAAGPYRYMRNPLYLGSMLTALSVSILMPASGALFFLVALPIFLVRLVLREESFLQNQIGETYTEYCKRVLRWLPSLSPKLPSSGFTPAWASAILGEVFPLGVALCFAVFAWNYNAQLLIRCVLICFGASLIVRALVRPSAV